MNFAVLFAISGCVLAAPEHNSIRSRDNRIIGGRSVDITEAPYQLSVQYRGSHACGASIIGREWALTAHHCTPEDDRTLYKLISNTSYRFTYSKGAIIHDVIDIYRHEKYTDQFDYDVAVFRIKGSFLSPNSRARAIHLADEGTMLQKRDSVEVTGWGVNDFFTKEQPEQLQKTTLSIVDRAECAIMLKNANPITNNMVCAGNLKGGNSPCNGDSGGPLVLGTIQVGIVSWARIGCIWPRSPEVFTDVGSVRKWIFNRTGI